MVVAVEMASAAALWSQVGEGVGGAAGASVVMVMMAAPPSQ
jgi:hypothetical protein